MKNEKYVIYIGNYLDENIVKTRGLPTRNPAGSNRIYRIANAIRASKTKLLIISPGVSLRIKFKNCLLYNAVVSKAGKVPVVFIPSVGLPILGALSAYFFMPWNLLRLTAQRKVSAVIIYNFSPLFVLLTFICRYILNIPVFNNIEDVSILEIRDWSTKTEANPLQQLIFFFCMKVIAAMSKGIIIPTIKFLPYFDANKPHRVVTGCIQILENERPQIDEANQKISVLFAGKIEFAHGIDLFVDTLETIGRQEIAVDICGGGGKSEWLQQKLHELDFPNIKYHGFVSDEQYQKLLAKANICIALQDPGGRYAANKTPSKVYEYLANYKAVVTSDVGDFSQLPENVITICKPFTKERLVEVIDFYIKNSNFIASQGHNAGKYAKEHYSYENVGQDLSAFITG